MKDVTSDRVWSTGDSITRNLIHKFQESAFFEASGLVNDKRLEALRPRIPERAYFCKTEAGFLSHQDQSTERSGDGQYMLAHLRH